MFSHVIRGIISRLGRLINISFGPRVTFHRVALSHMVLTLNFADIIVIFFGRRIGSVRGVIRRLIRVSRLGVGLSNS